MKQAHLEPLLNHIKVIIKSLLGGWSLKNEVEGQ